MQACIVYGVGSSVEPAWYSCPPRLVDVGRGARQVFTVAGDKGRPDLCGGCLRHQRFACAACAALGYNCDCACPPVPPRACALAEILFSP
jgi:hypothetical protein